MESKDKVALFDFCETLVDFQTADEFVHYYAATYFGLKRKMFRVVYYFLSHFKIIKLLTTLWPNRSINKRLILLQLYGEPLDKVEKAAFDYYTRVIRKHFIKDTIKILRTKQKEGFDIYIVSGAYNTYLRFFMAEFDIPLEHMICTEIKFRNGKCCGAFIGNDCLRNEKTIRLNKIFRNAPLKSIAYSDSESDVPFLNWAHEAVVIRNEKKEKWNNKYNEIVWSQN